MPKFEAVMAAEADSGVEMTRIKVEIDRHRRRYLSRMEDDPANQLLWPIIKFQIYADRSDGDIAEAAQ